jgi:hypothetical protein
MPDNGGYSVVPSSLRKAAGIWDSQGTAIGSVILKAQGLSLGRIEAGVFQLIVGPYDEVVTQVAGRCSEGQKSMDGMAARLNTAAQNYQDAEQGSTNAANSVG